MKVLLTGATGFIGSRLFERLKEETVEIRLVIRNPNVVDRGFFPDCELVKADIIDPVSLASAFTGIDTVFHLAASIHHGRAGYAEMQSTNVGGTKNVVEACQQKGVLRLVYMSSVAAIGASFDGSKILNENSPYNLKHLKMGYFDTKHEAEQLVLQAVRNKMLDAVIINPATVFGAGDAIKKSRNIQLAVARGKFPFFTLGGFNVIAVEDVVSATIEAWKRGRNGERYIVSGENLTFKQFFEFTADAAGVPPPKILLPDFLLKTIGKVGDTLERLGMRDIPNSESAWTALAFQWFDNSKAKRELNLDPRPAREAIRNSILWAKEHGII